MISSKRTICFCGIIFFLVGETSWAFSTARDNYHGIDHGSSIHVRAATVPTAPLDPNENIHHTLDEVNTILGVLGGSASKAVMGLTGISITDCALTIKEEDLATITCAQFIEKLSECDSLANVKPLLQQAKNKYKSRPNSRSPCFARRGKHQG